MNISDVSNLRLWLESNDPSLFTLDGLEIVSFVSKGAGNAEGVGTEVGTETGRPILEDGLIKFLSGQALDITSALNIQDNNTRYTIGFKIPVWDTSDNRIYFSVSNFVSTLELGHSSASSSTGFSIRVGNSSVLSVSRPDSFTISMSINRETNVCHVIITDGVTNTEYFDLLADGTSTVNDGQRINGRPSGSLTGNWDLERVVISEDFMTTVQLQDFHQGMLNGFTESTPVDPALSSVNTTSPHDADGESASTVTVVLVDTESNPVTGLINSDFSISLTGSASDGVVTETATQGTYTFEVTNTEAETVTVTVVADGVELNDNPQIAFDEVLTVTNVSPADGAQGVSRTPTLQWSEDNAPANRYYQVNIVPIANQGATPDFSESTKVTVEGLSYAVPDELLSTQWYAWKIIAKILPEPDFTGSYSNAYSNDYS